MAYGFPDVGAGQPMYTWSPTQQVPTIQRQSMIFYLVGSDQDVENWNVLPGNSVFFMNMNAQLLYIKTVDFSGSSKISKFEFSEVVNNGAETPEYITRDEFEKRLQSYVKKHYSKTNEPKKGEKSDE